MRLAAYYDQHILPHMIRMLCGMEPIMKVRAAVIPLAKGRVFELGCGGGINQPLYDACQVTGYCGIDPSPRLLEFARAEATEWGSAVKQA